MLGFKLNHVSKRGPREYFSLVTSKYKYIGVILDEHLKLMNVLWFFGVRHRNFTWGYDVESVENVGYVTFWKTYHAGMKIKLWDNSAVRTGIWALIQLKKYTILPV